MKFIFFLSLVFAISVPHVSGSDKDKKTPQNTNVLKNVNRLRARRGLHALVSDSEMNKIARIISTKRAARGRCGHLRGWHAGTAKSEGVGCRTGNDPNGLRFISCCLYDKKWRSAGAAATVRNGKTYYTLLVK